MSNVAFRGMGQANTARAALTISSTSDAIALHRCTVSHCFGPGVQILSAALVNMTNNVVLDTEGPAIAVYNDPVNSRVEVPEMPRVVLVNNTAGFARMLGSILVSDTVASFVVCPYAKKKPCVTEVHGNIAAGSENYGFVFGRSVLACVHAHIIQRELTPSIPCMPLTVTVLFLSSFCNWWFLLPKPRDTHPRDWQRGSACHHYAHICLRMPRADRSHRSCMFAESGAGVP